MDFCDPEGIAPNNSRNKIAFGAQQLHLKNKISMFCGLKEKEHIRFWKKKGKKKEQTKEKEKKKLITAKNGLVGMLGYLKTYRNVKPFLT